MRNKLTKITYAVGFGLALAFTSSYSDNKDDDPTPSSSSGLSFNENSRIYIGRYEDTGNGEVFIADPYSASGWIGMGLLGRIGTVTNGTVSLDWPTELGIMESDYSSILEYLPIYEDEIPGNCTDSDDIGIIGVYGADFDLYEGDNKIGGLFASNQSDEVIIYWYFLKDEKITCNVNDEKVITINATKGWNPIYRKYTYIDDGHGSPSKMEFSTNNILTKEVKWFLNYTGGY